MTRKRKDYRELKVSSFSGYGYKSAPMLRIQGLWLTMMIIMRNHMMVTKNA